MDNLGFNVYTYTVCRVLSISSGILLQFGMFKFGIEKQIQTSFFIVLPSINERHQAKTLGHNMFDGYEDINNIYIFYL